jgi:DNA processing protein
MASSLLLQFAVASLGFLSTGEKLRLCREIEDEAEFVQLSLADLENFLKRPLRSRAFHPDTLLAHAAAQRKILTRRKIEYTFYEDTRYPPQLREIYDPPFMLFFRGRLPDYERPLLGVVGTRRPSGKSAKAAYGLGFDAGRNGVDVVSGLARGIDGRAHQGNLDGGGRTIAVLGCGIDGVYPLSHRALAAHILDAGGLIVSEYPPGTPPLRHHFPARNRILSGLCRAIVVVEAPVGSGALITADYALEQGRDLYVHTDGLSGPTGEGTHALAESGAPVIRSAAEVLQDWGIESVKEDIVKSEGVDLVEAMREELAGKLVRNADEYIRRSGNG